jgi:hypothetical protein
VAASTARLPPAEPSVATRTSCIRIPQFILLGGAC